EGRLKLGSFEPAPLKKPSWWSRLFKKKREVGAIVSEMMPVDQTVPVQKLPFEVQSLYDEPNLVSTSKRVVKNGTCSRCWRRGPLNTGQVCARCAVQHG